MKNYLCIKILTITVFLFVSCRKENKSEFIKSDNLETINLDISSLKVLGEKGNFDDYFDSYSLIPLETTTSSIISKISRIYFCKGKIFILDKKTNQIFIFNKNGKFFKKINSKGKGPNEYVGLRDFTINEDTNEIIVYSYFPKKILVYNFEGQFVKQFNQKKEEKEYRNIAYDGKKYLFLLDKVEEGEPFLIEKSLNLETENTFLNAEIKDKIFDIVSFGVPNIIKSNSGLYTSFVYSDTIYKYNKSSGFEAKYYIDFGAQKTPLQEYKKQKHDFFSNLDNNRKYGFGITDFRETKNFVIFKYHGYKMIIYSKKDKKANKISSFYKDYISFSNYKAHDDNDDNIISIVDAELFSSKMNFFDKNEDKWNQVPDKIKEIFKNTSATDNPLLLVYKFK
jgi:hypothetical protein